MHSTFSSTAHCGAYQEDYLRSQLAHTPLFATLSLQCKGLATWARVCLLPAYRWLGRIAGQGLRQQRNEDEWYGQNEF